MAPRGPDETPENGSLWTSTNPQQYYGSIASTFSQSPEFVVPSRSRTGSSLPLSTQEHRIIPHSPLFSSCALVLRTRESNEDFSRQSPIKDEGAAGVEGAFFTLVKVCMGTGALALPYAFLNGGLFWGALGIILMARWNYFASNRLLACKELLDSAALGADDVEANDVYAFIALKALGRPGAILVRAATGVTFVGCGVSYLIAASDLLEITPVSLVWAGSPIFTRLANTLLCVLVVLPLSCAKSLSFLSYTSFFGIIALLLSFITIIALGINHTSPTAAAAAAAAVEAGGGPSAWDRAFETDAKGLSRFFGIACFSFGIPPLLFPIQGSMPCPEFFRPAVGLALVSVAAAYILIAETVVLLYDFVVPPNILTVLSTSPLSTTVRLSMVLVCVLTYPLAIVPLCESVEKALEGPRVARIYRWESLQGPTSYYQPRDEPEALSSSRSILAQCLGRREEISRETPRSPSDRPPGHMPRYQQPHSKSRTWSWRVLILRACIVFATALLATLVPCFGGVVAFLGAFSVAILSFVLPPLFHLILFNARLLRREALIDVGMFFLGLVVCVGATSLTARTNLYPLVSSHTCPH